MKLYIVAISLILSLNLYAKSEELKFTGYKFTSKAGVSGTFKSMEWKYNKKGKTVAEKLLKAKVKIDSYSIDAGNSARNTNITNSLFKNWGGRYILGEVKKVDTKARLIEVDMSIGSKMKKIIFQYHEANKQVVMTTRLDLLSLGFNKAFAMLSNTCEALHTGKDGVSKTWSDVDVEIKI